MKCIATVITILFFVFITIYAIVTKNKQKIKSSKKESISRRLFMLQSNLFVVVFSTITFYIGTVINENLALIYPFLLIIIYIFYDIIFDIWLNKEELSKDEKNWIILMTEISCCIVMISSVNVKEIRLAIELVLAYMFSAHFPYMNMIKEDFRKSIGIKHLFEALINSIFKIKDILVLEKNKRNSLVFGILMAVIVILLEKYYEHVISIINGVEIGTGIYGILVLIVVFVKECILKIYMSIKEKK